MNPHPQKPINEKFSEAVLFILQSLPNCRDIGLKKLAKLLYFADFNFYKKHYKSITNESYGRLEFGPFPRELYGSIEFLKNKGLISIKEVKYSDTVIGNDLSLRKKFKSKYLSEEEKKELLHVAEKLGKLTATQLQALSHEDTPWQVTDEKAKIDYDLVFYRDCEIVTKVE